MKAYWWLSKKSLKILLSAHIFLKHQSGWNWELRIVQSASIFRWWIIIYMLQCASRPLIFAVKSSMFSPFFFSSKNPQPFQFFFKNIVKTTNLIWLLFWSYLNPTLKQNFMKISYYTVFQSTKTCACSDGWTHCSAFRNQTIYLVGHHGLPILLALPLFHSHPLVLFF